jgi:hypothetical protein
LQALDAPAPFSLLLKDAMVTEVESATVELPDAVAPGEGSA